LIEKKDFYITLKELKQNYNKGYPANDSGNDGEERVVKTPDGKLRLYRKELGAWHYLEFTRS
jgi:hypothetical protein